jgi:hypothetical protein
MVSEEKASGHANKTAVSFILDWGSRSHIPVMVLDSMLTIAPESPLPPTILATLITALHARPFQPMLMLFPPLLLFSSYTNLNSLVIDSAGITATGSGLYMLLARNRETRKGLPTRSLKRLGARGLIKRAAMGISVVNLLAGGITYAFEKRLQTPAA